MRTLKQFKCMKRIFDCCKLILPILFFAASSLSFNSFWKAVSEENASIELRAMNEKFQKEKYYSFEVIYKTYDNHTTQKVFEENQGKVIKRGVNYRSEIMGKVIVQDKNLRVTLDSASKIMKVNNPILGADAELSLEATIKLLQSCNSVQKSTEKEFTAYRFEFNAKKGLISQEIYYDSEFIKRIIFYYATDNDVRINNTIKKETVYPKLVIDFIHFEKSPKVDDKTFNTDQFVKEKKGKLIASTDYQKFKLIDGRYYK